MQDKRLRGCLFTGASGRLGTAFCQKYVDRYAIVAVNGTRPLQVHSQRQRLVDPLEPDAILPENEHPVHEIQADLADDNDLRRVIEVALARLGTIDLLVNAAVRRAPTSSLVPQSDGFQQHFLVNTLAPIRLAAMVAEACWLGKMDENRRFNRNVINLSSTCGTYIRPGSGQMSGYGASKAALNFLSCELAHQLRMHGVRVNVLAPTTFPGPITTDTVVNHIVTLDRCTVSGRIVVIDQEGLKLIRHGRDLGKPSPPAPPSSQSSQPQEKHPLPEEGIQAADVAPAVSEATESAESKSAVILPSQRDQAVNMVAARPSVPESSPSEIAGDSAGLGGRTVDTAQAQSQATRFRPLRVPDHRVPALRNRFQTNCYVKLPTALAHELLPLLGIEAEEKESHAVLSEWDRYGLGEDASYFSGPMRFSSAAPGPWLTWLHHHPTVVELVRGLTGNPRLAPNENRAYMYYSDGCFIDVHTDVPACVVTLLTSVVGQVPPLVVYPRLRNYGVTQLVDLASAAGGAPEGGREVEVPRAGFLAISGRDLPHRRPEVHLNGGRVVLATLCYSEASDADQGRSETNATSISTGVGTGYDV